ncbi:flavin monoamine oxidase family protein [Mucilaginibacter segetis]|uniref:Tryptophan 2-monooxygenase n=1 Tax=Mucilaginibacter segetis TaxID=2793071 RepID=A0A934PRC8_9SPHI|nr:flavin monoamine oxidase family protein [Mucilaginibacter segetis]MBK0378227.1 flavin monoamine oxidase family protein [Mucilaginibacter segetis]
MKTITRRDFLGKGAMLAGGAYPAMLALGMLRAAPAHAFDLAGSGNGKHVIILGGGLTGMTSAYELAKLGYKCTILEARQRAGGRCWSIRNGATNIEAGQPGQTGETTQKASFDAGLYFNAGPSRIPHNHELSLHYCKELGIPIQVYNNVNEGAYYFAEGNGPLSNKKIRVREIHNDIRGYMSELLAKSIDHSALDTGLTKEDTEKVIEYLMAEGGLDPDKLYKASARRGYTEYPGAGDKPGKIADAYKLADIINSGLMDPDFYNVAEYTYELQMTMFQAVGGMDQIAIALEKKVAPMLKMGAEVTQITNLPEGVKITYKDASGMHELQGDLCICTLPLPVLSNINQNFSGEVSRAIDYISYMQTGKIGMQFKRRFWEEDEHLYGGITHTNNDLTQIFYPSNDYLSKKGTLIGYYNFNEKAARIGDLSFADREKFALEKGRLIHPQYDKEFESAFSISWHKTKYNLGGWAVYTNDTRKNQYPVLLKPEKQVYFAGEHLTYLNAWMAGAFESARSVVTAIHARVTDQRVTYPATGATNK